MGAFALGAAGFLSALLVCAAGLAAGWTLRGRLVRLDAERAELDAERAELDAERAALEEKRRRTEAARQEEPADLRAREIQAQQEAFRRLQSYSAADAYGLDDDAAAAAGGGS